MNKSHATKPNVYARIPLIMTVGLGLPARKALVKFPGNPTVLGWLVVFWSFTTRSTTKAIVSRLHEAENEDTDQSGTLPYSYYRRDLSGSLSCPEESSCVLPKDTPK